MIAIWWSRTLSKAPRSPTKKRAGCVTGAEDVALYAGVMGAAGFVDISIVDKGEPAVELAGHPLESGPARLFSARVTAVKG